MFCRHQYFYDEDAASKQFIDISINIYRYGSAHTRFYHKFVQNRPPLFPLPLLTHQVSEEGKCMRKPLHKPFEERQDWHRI